MKTKKPATSKETTKANQSTNQKTSPQNKIKTTSTTLQIHFLKK